MKTKLSNFFLVALYATTLLYTYVNFVQPPFAYTGLQINERLSFFRAGFVIVLASSLSGLVPTKIGRPSALFNALTYLLVYVPSTVVGYAALTDDQSHFTLAVTFSLCMLAMLFIGRSAPKSFRTPTLRAKEFRFIVSAAILLLSMCVFAYYRPDFAQIFSLEDINALYDIRGEYRESSVTVPVIVQYMFSWLAKLFSPALLVYGLMTANKKLVLGSLALTFSLFVISGHKSIFLGSFAVFGLWWSVKERGYITFRRFVAIATGLALMGLSLSFLGIGFVNEIIIRRAMIVPGVLSSFYVEFFSQNQLAKLGYSILSPFIDYPYSATPPFVIGEQYFGRPEMSANANFIAAGFAEFGVLGALLFSVGAACIYKTLDGFARKKNLNVGVMLLALIPTWALVDSALLTTLVTHGLALLLIAVALFPKTQRDIES